MIITCPLCQEKLPDNWAGRRNPRRGEVIECGLCGNVWKHRSGEPSITQMQLYSMPDGTVEVRLRKGRDTLAWACTPAEACLMAKGLQKAAGMAVQKGGAA